jgi:two-component sensor histidine kinase
MVDCSADSHQQPLLGSPITLSEDALNSIDVSEPTIDKISWSMNLILTESQLKHLDVVPFLMDITSSLAVKQDDSTIFLVLSELFNNALDHGVLKLDSSLKDHENGMQDYYAERASRLQKLDTGQIEIDLERLESHYGSWLKIKFRDSGKGFDFESYNKSSGYEERHHGRGLKLISSVCEYVEFQGNGSEVLVYLDLTDREELLVYIPSIGLA